MSDTQGAEAAYQSLYRRFRPQRFDEVLGQEHVALALRNAVRDHRVGHAYLFSGPRGTGKTSTARILAKALDCAAPVDGEPCGVCTSCIEIARGTSMDVHELDAASNNGVDAMRELVARAALSTPGRWKVYIVDEVHMLSTAASNALLKTLEEPPSHVVFVLATTEPQKVLPTIRSRTQHFEFRLLGPEAIGGLLAQVREAAGLEVDDEALESALRRGRGSARDALSALDQIASGAVVRDEITAIAEMADALAERDARALLVEVAKAAQHGHDPQRIATDLAEQLRQAFLSAFAPELVSVSGQDRRRIEELSRKMGLPPLVRAMEALGLAVVEMREAPDPRVHLEATLVRLSHPEVDDSGSALLARIEHLERAVADLQSGAAASTPKRTPSPGDPRERNDPAPAGRSNEAAPPPDAGRPEKPGEPAGPSLARRALRDVPAKRQNEGGQTRASGASGASGASVASGASTASMVEEKDLPSRDDIVQAWGDGLLSELPSKARVRFRVGRFLSVEGSTAVYALPNETHRAYCEEVRSQVEAVLATRFGTPLGLRLVVDDEPPAELQQQREIPGEEPATDEPDLLDRAVLEAETRPAGSGPSPEQLIKLAFPGAEEV